MIIKKSYRNVKPTKQMRAHTHKHTHTDTGDKSNRDSVPPISSVGWTVVFQRAIVFSPHATRGTFLHLTQPETRKLNPTKLVQC